MRISSKKTLVCALACIAALAAAPSGRTEEAANPDGSARKAYRPDTPLKNTEHPAHEKYQAMLDDYMARPDRYTERWRPQFHFSTPQGWMNDPNGLVCFDGKYRMCFQHRHGTFDGRTSWGNSYSMDLVHWTVLPPAIVADELGAVYSGTAAVDWKDSSGFFDGKPGLLAMFTCNRRHTGQVQGLAFSRDGGDTWRKYAGNPVIENYGTPIFIDPKLFWHEPTRRWIAFIGGHGKLRIYSSPNAREWRYESTIEEIGPGGEVADVFRLPVNNDPNNVKWVWSAVGVWFVVGDFDGHEFTPETGRVNFDAGPDAWAAQSWSDMPPEDGRRVFTYWVWEFRHYRRHEAFRNWCGALTLPRTLSLLQGGDGNYRMAQTPVRELKTLRGKTHSLGPLALKAGETRPTDIRSNTLEIAAKFEPADTGRFGIRFLKGGGQQTVVGYDAETRRMFMDRSRSGSGKGKKTESRELLPEDGRVRLRVFADVSIVEAFGNGGVANMTGLVLPEPENDAVEIFAEGAGVRVSRLDLHEMKSIWRARE